MSKIVRNGAPTSTTPGILGQEYYDKETGKSYICTNVNYDPDDEIGEIDGTYTWEESSGASSWNDLTDKPFYEVDNRTILIPETVGTVDSYRRIEYNHTPLTWELGDTVTIVWDGVEYESTCVENSDACYEYGFRVGGGDYVYFGETGFICNHSGYLVVGDTHTYEVYTGKIETKHIDPKYIKDMYYTGDTVEVEVLSPRSFLLYGSGSDSDEPQITDSYIDYIEGFFVAGQPYKVTWDGTTYECVCVDDNGLYIGNPYLWDLLYKDNGMPFCLYDDGGDVCVIYKMPVTETLIEISVTTLAPEIHKIHPKYLPEGGVGYMGEPEKGVLLEGCASNEDISNCFCPGAPFIEGNEYTVRWYDVQTNEGSEYKCIARNDGYGDIYIGNQSLTGGDFSETIESDEPFFFCIYESDDVYMCFAEQGQFEFQVIGMGSFTRKIDMKFMPDEMVNRVEEAHTRTEYGLSLLKVSTSVSNPDVAWFANGVGCYGDGKYMARFSNNGGVISYYSGDGLEWFDGSSGVFMGSAEQMVYGNGRFILPTSQGLLWSNDAITWNKVTIPSGVRTSQDGGWWHTAAYGNGVFVAAYTEVYSGSQKVCMYSTDAVNWIGVDLPSTAKKRSHIIYANDKFWMIDGTETMYSSDGITWESEAMVTTDDGVGRTFAYINGTFVWISASDRMSYSKDAINWTTVSSTEYNWGDGMPLVEYNNVLYAFAGNAYSYTADGITWEKGGTIPHTFDKYVYVCPIASDDKMVALCGTNTRSTAYIWFTVDGKNWYRDYPRLYYRGSDVTDYILDTILIK